MDLESAKKIIGSVLISDGVLWDTGVSAKLKIDRIKDYLKILWGALPNDVPTEYFYVACEDLQNEGARDKIFGSGAF